MPEATPRAEKSAYAAIVAQTATVFNNLLSKNQIFLFRSECARFSENDSLMMQSDEKCGESNRRPDSGGPKVRLVKPPRLW
jgi:hypothetical protein